MLYNTGTIAINGNTATGTGTNWTAPANQIRAGQTILVLSSPVQVFQISSVDSATSLTVTPAASPALSGQKYAIMVSDIISVDGLAQAMSQLIKEYDENIGAWETFATTNSNQNITVTINGTSLSIPAIGKLLQKGSNGALPVNQGGTGATKVEDVRTNLGLGDSATRSVGTAAGTVAAGDDNRLNTLDGKTGGALKGTVSVPSYWGSVTHARTINGFTVAEHFEDSASFTSFTGGGTGGAGGAWRAFISYGALTYPNRHPAATITIANDYDLSTGVSPLAEVFLFDGDGGKISFQSNTGQGYKEVAWTGTSDERYKENITDYDGSESLSNIERMHLKKFSYIADEDGIIRRGVIAQQIEEIDPEYVHHNVNPLSGEEVLTLDTNVLLMDAICAINAISKRLKILEGS